MADFNAMFGRPLFYDIDGTPLTTEQWGVKSNLKRTENYGRVGSDRITVDGVELWVSTCWLDNDMSMDFSTEDPIPIIFETAVFDGGGLRGIFARWPTWETAEKGHQLALEMLQNGTYAPGPSDVAD